MINEITKEDIDSISKSIRARFSYPCKIYNIDVEDLIQDVFDTAIRRGSYDSRKSSPVTYHFWIARSVFSHKKQQIEKRASQAKEESFDYAVQTVGSDETIYSPEASHILAENRLEARRKLSSLLNITEEETLLIASGYDIKEVLKYYSEEHRKEVALICKKAFKFMK